MNRIFIFDTEVLLYDWLAVFKEPGKGQFYNFFQEDSADLKQFLMDNKDSIFVGFNNKGYDRFVLAAMVNDSNTAVVKEVNDFIISGNNGWEYPDRKLTSLRLNFVDLMSDCQQGLSLKAIEGHLGENIKESDIPFDIDRPLTESEREELLRYCQYDVISTEKLYGLRKDYLENKKFLGSLKGIPEEESLGLTNAKLTALYLGATPTPHNDEREYQYPDNLLKEYIPEQVFEFFDRLKDKDISDDEVFHSQLKINIGECPVTIGFGGIHACIPNYYFDEGGGQK